MVAEELNDPKIKAFLEHLMGMPHNKKCADCSKDRPAWAAITFAFFICYECAGKHRALGPSKSKVKSTAMDRWSIDELRRMHVGGNKYAYRLGDSPDIAQKYDECACFVEEIDRLCKESQMREPGDEFMNQEKNIKKTSFGNAVVRKKTLPKFSSQVKLEAPQKHEEEAVHEEPAAPPTPEKDASTEAQSSDSAVLARSSKKSLNLKRNVGTSRSPFSFKPEEIDETESE